MKFEKLGLIPQIAQVIENEFGFNEPTEIQKRAIPPALNKKQIFGVSPSGTGKTLAFLAPMIQNIIHIKVEHELTLGIIITPTLELSNQITKVAIELGKAVDFNVLEVVAGVSPAKIRRAVKKRVDLIVGTPLKLLDMASHGVIDISKILIGVLDECDVLLKMGFYETIVEISEYFKSNQGFKYHLFSATSPIELEKIGKELMNKPHMIDIARMKVPNKLKQAVYEVLPEEKNDIFFKLLHDNKIQKVLIFVRSQEAAFILGKKLGVKGLDNEIIHGGLSNIQRNTAIRNFENGIVDVLISTDLVSRGIDIDSITHVINYDVSADPIDYIHRVGRTARAGKSGVAWTLATPEDLYRIEKIERMIGENLSRKKRLPDELRKTKYEKKQEKFRELQKEKKKRSFNKGWLYKRKKPEDHRKKRLKRK